MGRSGDARCGILPAISALSGNDALRGRRVVPRRARSRCPRDRGARSHHPGSKIAIVGHNVVNRAFLAPLLGLSIEQAREIRQSNGGINVIDVERGECLRILTINSALHVDGLLDEDPAGPR